VGRAEAVKARVEAAQAELRLAAAQRLALRARLKQVALRREAERPLPHPIKDSRTRR
jgi:hypothetical protein